MESYITCANSKLLIYCSVYNFVFHQILDNTVCNRINCYKSKQSTAIITQLWWVVIFANHNRFNNFIQQCDSEIRSYNKFFVQFYASYYELLASVIQHDIITFSYRMIVKNDSNLIFNFDLCNHFPYIVWLQKSIWHMIFMNAVGTLAN